MDDTNLILQETFESRGWFIVPGALSVDRVAGLKSALDEACAIQRPIQIRNGVGEGTEGTAHHLPAHGGEFLRFISDMPLVPVLEKIFHSHVIINTFGASIIRRGYTPYVRNVHRDVRSFSTELSMVNMLVM